jgi:CheY-like chemotaxis protein
MPFILIIDDDSHLRLFVRHSLERAGHQVQEASDGHKGIELYRKQPANLVLCDLVMPKKEGIETIRELRRLDPRVKLIAMSGSASLYSRDLLPVAEALGADRTLRKPFEVDALLSAVDDLLRVSACV